MLKTNSVLALALALALLGVGCSSASDAGTQPSAGSGGAAAAGGVAGSSNLAGGSGRADSGAGGIAGSSTAGTGGASGAGAAGAGGAGGASGAGVGGNAGSSGTGGSGGGAGRGGGGGAAGSTTNDDYLKTHRDGYGFVAIAVSSTNQILSLSTTLAVPAQPNQNTGTLFLWPGLQPGGANYEPIDNGVLQPVLTWGPTCAPNSPKDAYASWWVSAQYVNTFGKYAGYTGCTGGDGMNVQTGDALKMVMTLSGSVWHQTVTDTNAQHSVSYDVDMLGQAQNSAEFVIEMYTEPPVADVVFTATTVTFENPEPASCQPSTRGMNDFFTNPHASADGK
ncbi:MAG TPA: hypothetical protein VIK01_22295, partial [Polyangiaceae bacterium]